MLRLHTCSVVTAARRLGRSPLLLAMILSSACDTFDFNGPGGDEGPGVIEPSKVLMVTATTFGIDISGTYVLEVTPPGPTGTVLSTAVPSNGTEVLNWTGDPDGQHAVYLIPESFDAGDGTTAVDCSVRGQNPRTISIVAGGDTARTTFEMDCSLP